MITTAMREQITEHVVPTPGSGLPPEFEALLDRRPTVVGLGATVRHAARPAALMRAVTTELIDHHGFRAVAVEGTDSPFDTAPALDRYVTRGEGDLRALVRASQGFLRRHEIYDLLTALRTHNTDHPGDPVRIVHRRERREPPNSLIEVEQELAARAVTWHAATGQRIVHWGGAAHVVAADPRGIATGGDPDPDLAHPNAGGRLRASLGSGYLAVAVTVGAVDGSADHPAIPDAPSSFAESAFGTGTDPAWLVTRGASPTLDDWLDSPLRIRCVGPTYDPRNDSRYFVTAPRTRDAVDAFLHVRHSTTTTPL